MLERLRDAVLDLMKVPPEPEPPAGDATSVRVFRASPNYYRYKRWVWAIGQAGALIGLVGSLVAIYFATQAVDEPLFTTVMGIVEGLAWAVYVIQLPVSLAIMRLDYELRWYILSDRALRIREGILVVKEQTMTFANVQQVGIRQGPLQRLLGISDVHVTSAGGASKATEVQSGSSSSGHEGFFRGVDNAAEIRDAIRRRVQLHRDAGLGDPDDAAGPDEGPAALIAANDLLEEMRALRNALGGGDAGRPANALG
jgi:membrane protein YdbS with pleckstrin-like domain